MNEQALQFPPHYLLRFLWRHMVIIASNTTVDIRTIDTNKRQPCSNVSPISAFADAAISYAADTCMGWTNIIGIPSHE